MALELNVIIDEDWQWRMENLPEFATGMFLCLVITHFRNYILLPALIS